MRRPRHLSAAEKALWDRVAERTTPMNPKIQIEESLTPKPPAVVPAPQPKRVKDFRVGEKSKLRSKNNLLPTVSETLSRAPLNMDHRSFGKMKQGKLSPEARIDLHGMTLAEAHPELITFILRSQSLGRRLVLVITGKGKNRDDGGAIPTRLGVLRHQVPQWLALPPLGSHILQVTPAHVRHGGHGAYYVYLRRNR